VSLRESRVEEGRVALFVRRVARRHLRVDCGERESVRECVCESRERECVCERERDRESVKEREREKGSVCERERSVA